MLSRRALMGSLAATAIGGISTAGCGRARPALPRSIPHPLLGRPAPYFEAQNAPAGEPASAQSASTVRVPDPTAAVVVVDFWASWCATCVQTMPRMEALYRELRPRGASFVGVNVDEDEQEARRALARLGTTFPNVLDLQRDLLTTYVVPRIPMTFVVDRVGTIRWVGQHPSSTEQVVRALMRPA